MVHNTTQIILNYNNNHLFKNSHILEETSIELAPYDGTMMQGTLGEASVQPEMLVSDEKYPMEITEPSDSRNLVSFKAIRANSANVKLARTKQFKEFVVNQSQQNLY